MIFKKTFQKYRFLLVFLNQALVLHVLCLKTVTDLVLANDLLPSWLGPKMRNLQRNLQRNLKRNLQRNLQRNILK